jgi:hypothetical protein
MTPLEAINYLSMLQEKVLDGQASKDSRYAD